MSQTKQNKYHDELTKLFSHTNFHNEEITCNKISKWIVSSGRGQDGTLCVSTLPSQFTRNFRYTSLSNLT
jgi:hypothetical protein